MKGLELDACIVIDPQTVLDEEFRGAQTHDPYKVSRAGLAEIDTAGMNREQRFRAAMNNWIAYITPRLAARTFDGVKDTRKFLEAVFTNLATGNHLGRNEGKLGGDFTFIGPGNLAKKLSHERVLQDLEDKKIRKNRRFSDAGMAEICHLHERLMANLRLGMSVFLDGHVRDAKKLLEEKARFRDLEREYAASHIARLQDNTAQSIETSSLHLDLISDLKRINSHICSIAYPILDSAGALAPSRLRQSALIDDASA